ncbi:hypothetical protein SAMN04488074_12891 [Lentzea albidocapillata subsp. violacea]|uniref:Uncharacterized protein n=1 Tax=Lentzea albidocapillata subsp. violacea TaxID=128104 RepID=A0A1G9WVE0_9PSEU|nr:hypothetical protein [Lentzea albidocapillata]SDM88430.1 hypothetical protein SAMN04488074_12891 [Lentzea albidocapillata subsp. violacea]
MRNAPPRRQVRHRTAAIVLGAMLAVSAVAVLVATGVFGSLQGSVIDPWTIGIVVVAVIGAVIARVRPSRSDGKSGARGCGC